MGLITWSDTSNAVTDTLVDTCWWRLGPRATQLCEPASKKDTTMKTTTLHDSKCPRDISECMCMMGSPWTYDGSVWHYVQLWSISTLLAITCKKMKETKIICVVHEWLQCKTPPMHEQWDHVVRVEEVKSECWIDLECIHMSDEEPWVFEQFLFSQFSMS